MLAHSFSAFLVSNGSESNNPIAFCYTLSLLDWNLINKNSTIQADFVSYSLKGLNAIKKEARNLGKFAGQTLWKFGCHSP